MYQNLTKFVLFLLDVGAWPSSCKVNTVVNLTYKGEFHINIVNFTYCGEFHIKWQISHTVVNFTFCDEFHTLVNFI